MSIPIIQVANVAHSTSFYANVCGALNIVYLTSSTSTSGLPQHHFGISGTPSETLFTLQQSPAPKPSVVNLTASNVSQVTSFHTLALASQAGHGTNLISQSDNGALAKTNDFDANLLEVRYERKQRRGSNGGGSIRLSHAPRMQRQNSSDSHREGTTLTTASTAKEAQRVLEWQRTVARSVGESSDSEEAMGRALAVKKPQPQTVVSTSTLTPQRRTPPPAAPSAPSLISQGLHQQQQQTQQAQIAQQLPNLIRAATAPVGAMTAMYDQLASALPAEKLDGSGLSTNGLIGTIIGAAAGAAIAYAMVKSEAPEKERGQGVAQFTAPMAYQTPMQMHEQCVSRSVSGSQVQGMGIQMGMQQQQMPIGHDMGHNMLSALRQAPQPLYAEPAQYYSPSGLKAPSIADSGYASKISLSRPDILRSRNDGGNSSSPAGSRVGSLREASYLEAMDAYGSSPKSALSASPGHSHHSSRSKPEGSHASKSSGRHTFKPEAARAETVVSKSSAAKSSATGFTSTSRASEAPTVKPGKSSAGKSSSKAPSAAYSDVKSSHTSHSRASEKSGSHGSVKSEKEKSRHSGHSERARRAPESVVGGYAESVVPEDSVSQVGSRHSGSRRRQEVY